MDKINLVDKFTFVPTSRNYTEEGYLIAPAKIARPGIQLYRGKELMKSESFPKDKFDADSVIRVYRPPEEVHCIEALNSFKNVAITNNHPPEGLLDARTHKKYAVGTVLSDVKVEQTSGCVSGTLKITDYDAVNAVKGGKVEMSAGYKSYVEFSPGMTPDGEPYDALQRGIEGNHVAIVDKGRAGSSMKIADADMAEKEAMKQMSKIKMMYDGKMYSVNAGTMAYDNIMKMMNQKMEDGSSEFIREYKQEKDETRREMEDGFFGFPKGKGEMYYKKMNGDGMYSKEKMMDAAKELAELKLKYEKLEAANVKLEAEADVNKQALTDAESKIPSVDAIDELVKERSEIIEKSKKLIGEIDTDGKSNADIKREVVTAKITHVDTANYDDAYVAVAFDMLVPDQENKSKEGKSTLGDSYIPADPLAKKSGNKVQEARERWIKRNEELNSAKGSK